MCDLDFYACETVRVYAEEFRKAAKKHACRACTAAITPGVKYVRVSWLTDYGWEDEKVCLRCHEIHQQFFKEHKGSLYSPGQIDVSLRDCIDNADSDDDVTRWKDYLKEIDERQKQNEQLL